MTDEDFRKRVVREARRWIGTPYLHQTSVFGQGADCLGLVRGVWRKCIGCEPEPVPEYSPDWGEISKNETMLKAAQKWFLPINKQEADFGDLILFKWKNSSIIKHAGILTSSISDKPSFIHSYEKAGVVETTLGSHWNARIAACFRFPLPEKFGK